MSLGRNVGLDPSDIVCVRWGPSSAPLPQKGAQPPLFGSCLLWPNGWVDQDATWYDGKPRPGQQLLDADPAPPPRGTAPKFRPMSVVAKQLDGSKCHLVGRQASAQAALCYMETQLPLPKGAQPPIFGRVYCGQTIVHLSYC